MTETSAIEPPDRATVLQLAPTGRLRVAVNLDNAVLVQRHRESDRLSGVVIDLAQQLALILELPLDITGFESAAKIVALADTDAWDLSFFAVDPERAKQVWYSPPYIVIEGSYMVPSDSPLQSVEDVDAAGVRVAVGQGAAYDLYLSRTLQHAQLVRDKDSPAAIDRFLADRLEAVAGVRQPLLAFAQTHAGLRVIDGAFTQIEQAAVTPLERPLAHWFVSNFVESVKASGFVAAALTRAGQTGAAVAAPARR
jgi:polar amino acid transport system substrate-binding protein